MNTLILDLSQASNFILIQGDPNQNLLFQLALSLNVGIPDPKLVKPKCVWEVEVFCVKNLFLEKLGKNKNFVQKYVFSSNVQNKRNIPSLGTHKTNLCLLARLFVCKLTHDCNWCLLGVWINIVLPSYVYNKKSIQSFFALFRQIRTHVI